MPLDSSDSPSDASSAVGRRLTILYVFALSTVAVLSIGAQLLIQWQLSRGESDSRVINIAGRQRMLSQRLAKASLRLDDTNQANRQAAQRELSQTLSEWSHSHEVLQRGDRQQRMPGKNSVEVARLFGAIEQDYQAMRSAAEVLEATPPDAEPDAIAISIVQQHEADFLAGMDAIVSQFVFEAERKVARLRRLESAILALTLAVLLAEGLLIFRPAVQRIRLARQRMVAAKEQAEDANAAKTRFLANVSHELRTPMTAVLGMTELAREESDDHTRDEYLAIVEEAGGSLLGLLNDLIDLSRIDAGELKMAAEPFAPQEVVQRVARMMRFTAAAKHLEITTGGDIDPAIRLLGDAGRLEQVLLNLVANAIKATPEGSIAIGCTLVSAAPGEATLSYSVRDTGVGIDPADQQRIFEPFVQANEGGETTGAGLGLAICRRIAQAMDARITVLSTPGMGATLTFTAAFPTALSSLAEHDPAEPTAFTNSETGSLHVLVVEDTRVNQILLEELLTRAGHTVVIAGSGEDACKCYREEPFDVVLIDLQLPGIDGEETAQAIRHADAASHVTTPPLLCVTAHASTSQQETEPSLFDGVITKPIDRHALFRTLANLAGPATEAPAAVGSPDAPPQIKQPLEPGLIEELAAAYLSSQGEQREQLQQALQDRRLWDAQVLAHRFRGQVAYFDTQELPSQLGRLEAACKRNDHHEATRLGEIVLADLQQLTQRLNTTPAATETGYSGS